MIRTIFFDTSDTLYSNKNFKKAQSRAAIEILAKKRKIDFFVAEKIFAEKKIALKKKLPHITKVAMLRKFGISQKNFHEFLTKIEPRNFLRPDLKLKKILENLRKKFALGILTNISEKFLEKILAALEIDKNIFSFFVTIENTKNSKPHDEPFRTATALAGNLPAEILYVGDSETKDILPAKKNGLRTILVSENENSAADAVIPEILEIEKILAEKF